MSAEHLSCTEASDLGTQLRTAEDGNIVVGSFAAELIGESYPLSKAMSAIVFNTFTEEQLGRTFAEWCDRKERQP